MNIKPNAKIDKQVSTELVMELLGQLADAQGVSLPADTESLFDCGVLDSFGLLEFITTIEKEFKITIPEDDLVPSNFETIAKVRAYINGRMEH